MLEVMRLEPSDMWMSADILFITTTTTIEFSLGGSSPYTSTDKTNNNKYT